MESLNVDVCIRQTLLSYLFFFFSPVNFSHIHWAIVLKIAKIDVMSYAIGARNAFNNKRGDKWQKKNIMNRGIPMQMASFLFSFISILHRTFTIVYLIIWSHCYSVIKFTIQITSEASSTISISHRPIFVEPTFQWSNRFVWLNIFNHTY